MKFSIKTLAINEQGVRFRFTLDNEELSSQQVLNYWQSSPEALSSYILEIKKLGFDQFYWEHPAIDSETLQLPYECMLIKTEHFNRRKVDPVPFAEYLNIANPVAVFDNLGRNARLIVPSMKSSPEHYKHMGAFLNSAPDSQVMELFRALGKNTLEEINKRRQIWISTAGLGVIWLHIRLDTVPKYYKTKTYKDPMFLIRTHSSK